jgi:hypothetical protein
LLARGYPIPEARAAAAFATRWGGELDDDAAGLGRSNDSAGATPLRRNERAPRLLGNER